MKFGETNIATNIDSIQIQNVSLHSPYQQKKDVDA